MAKARVCTITFSREQLIMKLLEDRGQVLEVVHLHDSPLAFILLLQLLKACVSDFYLHCPSEEMSFLKTA